MNKNQQKRPALGRGLSALLSDSATDITTRYSQDTENTTVGSVATIKLSQIETNPFQPRTTFEEEALKELSESIKQLGIIQPVTVRKVSVDKYQLISGERRFRASQLAGLTEIPAYIRIANDQSMLEMAIVENVQRQDLDAIEVALSYQRLLDECKLTQEQLAEKMGKSRSNVANFLRLLRLPDAVQAALIARKISMGHARALLSLTDPDKQHMLLELILRDDLSVRAVEEWVKDPESITLDNAGNADLGVEKVLIPRIKAASELSTDHVKIQDGLKERFGKKAALKCSDKGNGKIILSFKNDQELQKLVDLLNG
ncbi:MAG: ParB/RepB/Spo0J family partition protein [Bacteroidota bacterium]